MVMQILNYLVQVCHIDILYRSEYCVLYHKIGRHADRFPVFFRSLPSDSVILDFSLLTAIIIFLIAIFPFFASFVAQSLPSRARDKTRAGYRLASKTPLAVLVALGGVGDADARGGGELDSRAVAFKPEAIGANEVLAVERAVDLEKLRQPSGAFRAFAAAKGERR